MNLELVGKNAAVTKVPINMLNLEYRKRRFLKINNKKGTIVNDLLAIRNIETKYFDIIKNNCLDYLVASYSENAPKFKKENEKIEFIKTKCNSFYSMTPNGFVIPKSHSCLEYNVLLKSYYKIFDDLKISKNIKFWQDPIGVCIKLSSKKKKIDPHYLRGYGDTSSGHIESWAGFSNLGINTLLPVIGNTNLNYTQFFEPLDNYDDELANNVNSNIQYLREKYFSNTPLKLGAKYKCGKLFMWDNCLLHNTFIKNESSIRIFIVNQFIPPLTIKEKKYEKISGYRQKACIEHKKLTSQNTLLFFNKQNDKKFKSTLNGKRSALNFTIRAK